MSATLLVSAAAKFVASDRNETQCPSLLIWACVCGYLAFGEVPDRYGILGSLLIVGSGLYALHREVVRRRTIAAGVPPGEPGA